MKLNNTMNFNLYPQNDKCDNLIETSPILYNRIYNRDVLKFVVNIGHIGFNTFNCKYRKLQRK